MPQANRKRQSNRNEVNATFSQTGGVRIGGETFVAFNATWSFALLRVEESALTLLCLSKRWVFRKASIRRLSKHDELFSVGLRIEHSIEDYTEFIVFWTFRFGRLQRELEQRGYTVSSSDRA